LLNKIKRGFSQLIYILGADHHGYIKRLHAIGKAAGFNDANISVIIGQLVRLVKNDSAVRMSKRKGKVYNLDDLIKEVGRDAVRYFQHESFDTPMDFDIDLQTKVNQNPVFYVQYLMQEFKYHRKSRKSLMQASKSMRKHCFQEQGRIEH
jgi:arginyl-tRNA synthetase